MTRITTGSVPLDNFLNGGYDSNIITTIYGPSGSGKTNLCLLAAVNVAEGGKNVLFIDTEGGIAVERIKQISSNYEATLAKILFINPVTFEDQKVTIAKLKALATEDVGLIIVDSIAMLYRLELSQAEEVYDVNSALGKQIASLVEIARTKNIPVLITNQVYADFEQKDKVKMVGGDLLKYGSKCLIELQKFANCRGLILRKHRSLPEGKELKFKIVQTGIEEVR